MSWYWWVLIAVVVIFLIRSALGGGRRGSKTPAARDDLGFLDVHRAQNAAVDQELEKVVALILGLPVVATDPAFSQTLSRNALPAAVSNFMRGPGLTGLKTQTQMLHVVVSPVRITTFVKLRPTEAQSAVREFIRIGEDTWAWRTRQVEDMSRAIRSAEEEASQVAAGPKS